MFGQIKTDVDSCTRRYVHVVAEFMDNGKVYPRILYWKGDDGIEVAYEIERPSDPRPAYSQKAGGQGLLYDVMIEGRSKRLFYDDYEGRFFVEQVKQPVTSNYGC
jgi:hypothetical protein